MASYINNPDKHHDARQWQALSGGHLMDENKNRLHDVKSLYLATLQDLQPIIAFAQGFKQGLQHISHRDPW